MKLIPAIGLLLLPVFAANTSAQQPLVYLNQNLGFNVEGFKYSQAEFPCNIDQVLVESLIEQGQAQGLNLEAVSSTDKIHNGVIPVIAIDVEQLVLGKKFKFGTKTASNLPKVQVTAALIQGEQVEMAKHSCAIATLSQFTPSTSVLDMGTSTRVCTATRKCLKDLSKDIIQWVKPQVK